MENFKLTRDWDYRPDPLLTIAYKAGDYEFDDETIEAALEAEAGHRIFTPDDGDE